MKPPKAPKQKEPSEADDEEEDVDAGAKKKKGWRDRIKLPSFLARKKKAKDGDEEEQPEAEAEAEEDDEEEGKSKGAKWAARLKLPAFLARRLKPAAEGDEEDLDAEAVDQEGEAGEEGEEGEVDEEALAVKRHKQIVMAAAGGFVLMLGMISGGAWWYFSGGTDAPKTAAQRAPSFQEQKKGGRVAMALPPAAGTLNTLVRPTPGQLRSPTSPAGRARAPGQPSSAAPGGQAADAPAPTYSAKTGDIGGAFGGAADPLGGTLNRRGARVSGEAAGIVVPAVTSTTVGRLPDQPPTDALAATPDARLVEQKQGLPGPLPITGQDGTKSWELYARPNDIDDGPRVAIMITGIGLSRAASIAAVTKLPPEITMVLDPYARELSDWVVRSRLAGHEVMMALPMESDRFPVYDAGPYALDTKLSEEENIQRLELVLSQASGYTGVMTMMGSRFETSEASLTPVLTALKERGLMLASTNALGTVATPKVAAKLGLPRVVADIVLDADPSRQAVQAKLDQLEQIVRDRTVAVAVAHPSPATIERLINWTTTVKQKGINLVPVSALADKQKL